MKSFTSAFSRTAQTLIGLLGLSLLLHQLALAALAAPVACSYTIQGGTTITLDDPATSFSFTVTASQSNCTWTVSSNNSWLKVTSGSNYTGTKQVTVSADANPAAGERTGTLSVAGQIFTVKQQGGCKIYVLGQANRTVSKAGAELQLEVANLGGCQWTIASEAPWITFKSPGEYFSSKEFTLTVASNPGAARTGKIRIKKSYLPDPTYITIYQEGTCSFTVPTTPQNVSGFGAEKAIPITTHPTCKATATSDSAWVKIDSVSYVEVNYTVAPNTGIPRTAKLTIAGQPVTIIQAEAPVPTLSSLDPGFVLAGASPQTLGVNGTNFNKNSQVLWNGQARQTEYVTPGLLRVSLLATDLKTAGTKKVKVYDSGTLKTSGEQSFLVLSPQASVSAASYQGEDIAPDSIVAAFGANLADSVAAANTKPLPTNLAGTTVRVIDSKNLERLAPLFFVSPGQVNYLMPAETALGKATVVITSASVNISLGYVNIVKVAPGIFTAAGNGTGIPSALALRVKANGEQVYEPIVTFDRVSHKLVAVPIDLTVPGEQVFLVLYGTGMRNHNGLNTVKLTIGGTSVTANYVGASGLTGLDQLNAELPLSLKGRGEVGLLMSADDKTANIVKLTFK